MRFNDEVWRSVLTDDIPGGMAAVCQFERCHIAVCQICGLIPKICHKLLHCHTKNGRTCFSNCSWEVIYNILLINPECW